MSNENHVDSIEVDPASYKYEDEEAYSSYASSTTTSVLSEVGKYREENGRKYHVYFGEDKNPMPTDEVSLILRNASGTDADSRDAD